MEENLNELERRIWNLLVEGSNQFDHPFHHFTVSSNSTQGVRLRTVVLRKTLVSDKRLIFFTDNRSRKWKDWIINPKMSGLFYDPITKLQVVLEGMGILHLNGSLRDEFWKKMKGASRKSYMTEYKPGTIAFEKTTGLRPEFEKKEIRIADSEAYKQNFGLIEFQIQSLEILELGEAGNSRALIQYQSDCTFKGHWLIP